MKKKIVLLIALFIMVALIACGKEETDMSDDIMPTPVPASEESESSDSEDSSSSEKKESAAPEKNKLPEGGFKVSESRLLDANGNEFVMRGVNHAHAWFAQYDETALAAIAKTGSNTVRIVCANGEQWTKDSETSIKKLIDLCKENKMICVLEVHDATGKDEAEALSKAANFWCSMKSVLNGNEAYVIVNIANEWMGSWDTKKWANAYKTEIAKLRDAGIRNLIMVDAPGWGQYGQAIVDKGNEILDSDPEKNIIFSVHMYGTAGGSKSKIKNVLQGAIDKKLCIIVGEFGYYHSDGDVDEAYIMEFCTQNNLGYLGWSWKGNGGGVEYLDIAIEWDGSRLSTDWGEVLINGKNGIKETSKKCMIFD